MPTAAKQVTLWRFGQGVAGKFTMAVLFDDLKRNFRLNPGETKNKGGGVISTGQGCVDIAAKPADLLR